MIMNWLPGQLERSLGGNVSNNTATGESFTLSDLALFLTAPAPAPAPGPAGKICEGGRPDNLL